MWEQTFKRWIDLVFWWLPKTDAPQQPAPQRSQPDATRATQEPAHPEAPVAGATPQQPSHAKEAAAASARKEAPQAKAPAREAEPKQRAAAETADDLTVIKGIGPAVQKKLQALGIRTFRDLAAADPESLVEQLKGRQPISQGQVRSWTKAADQQVAARH